MDNRRPDSSSSPSTDPKDQSDMAIDIAAFMDTIAPRRKLPLKRMNSPESVRAPRGSGQVEETAMQPVPLPPARPPPFPKKECRGDSRVQKRYRDASTTAKSVSTLFIKMGMSLKTALEAEVPQDHSPRFTKRMEIMVSALHKGTLHTESVVEEFLAVLQKGDHYNDDGEWVDEKQQKTTKRRRKSLKSAGPSPMSHNQGPSDDANNQGRVSPISD